MHKLNTDKLLKIVDLLDRSHVAVNNLERLSNNKHVYLELKKEIQDTSEDLKNRYGLMEYLDSNFRNAQLQREADKLNNDRGTRAET